MLKNLQIVHIAAEVVIFTVMSVVIHLLNKRTNDRISQLEKRIDGLTSQMNAPHRISSPVPQKTPEANPPFVPTVDPMFSLFDTLAAPMMMMQPRFTQPTPAPPPNAAKIEEIPPSPKSESVKGFSEQSIERELAEELERLDEEVKHKSSDSQNGDEEKQEKVSDENAQ